MRETGLEPVSLWAADFKSAVYTIPPLSRYWSQYKDSNLGPSGPKPDALARLRYTEIILCRYRIPMYVPANAPSKLAINV